MVLVVTSLLFLTFHLGLLFFMMSLTKGWSNLFIFSKNHSCVCVCLLFLLGYILVPFFYWIWVLFVLFLFPPGVRLDYYLSFLFISWNGPVSIYTSHLDLLLLCLINFKMLCLYFHLFSFQFHFFLFPQWPIGCLVAYCLGYMSGFFIQFFLVFNFWPHTILVREDTWYDFSLLNFTESCLWPSI